MDHPFKQFHLKEFLLEGLGDMAISNPTPIQTEVIPAVLQGRDVIGQSQTGTGKTLAYLLPLMEKIDSSRQELQALILAPTKELTRQIAETAGQLIGQTGIDVLLIQGGVDINRQIQRLRRNPQLVVGTPGRVLDLIGQGKLTAHTAKILVIDEADTMLEMGFWEEVEKIIQQMKKDKQILLFAATFPQRLSVMAKAFMKQPRQIDISPGERIAPAIENVFFKVRSGGKEAALLQLVSLYNPFLGLIFTRRKEQVEDLVTQLCQAGFAAEGLHGDMQKGQRKQVMQRFREAKSQLLVATDIASRGLDIEGVTHVFNFDPPISVDQYIHRVGRTGRAGDTGIAINIIVALDEGKLRLIEEKLGQRFKEKVIEAGRIVDKPVRRKVEAEIGGNLRQKPKTSKKFTGPNAKKKAVKEYRGKKGIKAEPPTGKGKTAKR